MGPGLIAGIAGNDAGGITTYSRHRRPDRAHPAVAVPDHDRHPGVVQEMAARLGVVTGQGLSDLIRDRFGVRWTVFAMVVLLVANLANTVAEFAGAAAALGIFGVPTLDHRAGRGRRALGARAVRQLPAVERVFLLVSSCSSPTSRRPSWPPRLGAGRSRRCVTPDCSSRAGAAAADGRRRRHDDHALHAVLPPVRGGREGHRRGGAAPRAGRRGRRARSGPT